MSQIHFIGGEKGGVGKSLVARVLSQYFIDRGLPFAGLDTDQSHGALLRFYADYSVPIEIDQPPSLDRIVEQAAATMNSRVLVDLAAQTQRPLWRWIEDSDVLAVAAELGVGLTYWHVMDSGRDSVDLLRKLLDQFGGKMRIVLVLNEVRGDRFDAYEASGLRIRVDQLGIGVMALHQLPDATLQKIDQHSASFWSALNQRDPCNPGSLGLLERQRVKVWLSRAYNEIDRLGV
jgi:hypothetical protein